MSANYAIYTSPAHQPIPEHLPTLIVTPHGKPHQVLYTYLHTNYNQENYLLTPSDQGDLCVAKLFPTNRNSKDRPTIKCEASRNLRWTIRNEGIQHPVYKLTLPNPENPQLEQPLFQVSKPNPNSPWWSLFYFTYAGHLIPPKRIEFGKIVKAPSHGPNANGETKITVTGKTEEEKAVWRTLGEGNEDMVEWILVCAALNVLDEEITKATEAAGVKLSSRPSLNHAPNPAQQRPHQGPPPPQQQQQQRQHSIKAQDRQLHPTGSIHKPPAAGAIRPAVYNNNPPPSTKPLGPPSSHSNSAHGHPRTGNGIRGPPPPNHSHHPNQPIHPSAARGGPGYGGPVPPTALTPGAMPPGSLPPGRGPARQGSVPPPEMYSENPSALPYARPSLSSSTSSSRSAHAPPHQIPNSQTRNPQYHQQQQHHHQFRPPHSHNNPNYVTPSPPTSSATGMNNQRPFVNNNHPSSSRAPIQKHEYPISRPKQVR